MQRVKPKMSRRKAFLVLFLILAGVGLLVWGGISLFSVRVVTNVTAVLRRREHSLHERYGVGPLVVPDRRGRGV